MSRGPCHGASGSAVSRCRTFVAETKPGSSQALHEAKSARVLPSCIANITMAAAWSKLREGLRVGVEKNWGEYWKKSLTNWGENALCPNFEKLGREH